MLEQNQTVAEGATTHAPQSAPAFTVYMLMTTAAGLVGFLMVYLIFFDSAAGL